MSCGRLLNFLVMRFYFIVLHWIFLHVCTHGEELFACRCIKGEPTIEEYYDMYTEAEQHSNQILETVMQSSAAQQFLTLGRVVVVKSQSVSYFLHKNFLLHMITCCINNDTCIFLFSSELLVYSAHVHHCFVLD